MSKVCEICGKMVAPHRKYCSRQCNGEATRRRREAATAGREWLYQKYVVEGLDCTQIAAIVGRDPKGVWSWLKGYGIPTRPRGSDERVHFKKGHKLRAGITHTPETREKIRQARIRDGHVPYLKDGVHHLKGKKGADTPNWKGGVTPERQSFVASDEWKAACRIVWKRDRGRCCKCDRRICDIKAEGPRFAIHHIVSFQVRELRTEPSNLVLLCRPCHLWVHSGENVNKEFMASYVEPRSQPGVGPELDAVSRGLVPGDQGTA